MVPKALTPQLSPLKVKHGNISDCFPYLPKCRFLLELGLGHHNVTQCKSIINEIDQLDITFYHCVKWKNYAPASQLPSFHSHSQTPNIFLALARVFT